MTDPAPFGPPNADDLVARTLPAFGPPNPDNLVAHELPTLDPPNADDLVARSLPTFGPPSPDELVASHLATHRTPTTFEPPDADALVSNRIATPPTPDRPRPEPVAEEDLASEPAPDETTGWGRRVSIAAAVVVVGAGAVVGYFVVTAADGPGTASTSTVEIPAPSDRSSPATANPGIFDSFIRPDTDDELGVSESGRIWIEEFGVWAIEDAAAMVVEPNQSGPTIAVANMGGVDGTVQTTMSSVARASGLVFRYENFLNYWAVTASPQSATWTVIQVVDGELTVKGSLGVAPVADGSTIGVRLAGPVIEVFVDGRRYGRFLEDGAVEGSWAGLIARDPTRTDARWSTFVAILLSDTTTEPDRSNGPDTGE